MSSTAPLPSDAPFVADNLALDFINSEYGVDDQRRDCFTDDGSVMHWLQQAGLVPPTAHPQAPRGLLDLARQLRDRSRAVVHAAMNGAPADLGVINQILETGRPVRELEWDGEGRSYRLVSRLRDDSPASLLEPVADALTRLITGDKFEFVRQCEAHDCILLFHDLTKSHRRRWCSMATCGNRMKVAAFRSRKKTE
ncbi:ABATE domain-containing protein [Pseudomonas sp. GD03944]|uniref:CGNR zinc finger domain-containing protein n=1 Tax=Pseudomonas sp. GD03944 TaxID=2975409 RepID=UPI002449B07F|nr:ABATE domain-containing protein [Pseudomonas sp. GD03944]MDH1263303.1 ABATE domain-containing protein [Pseudomonas sp. GD03944]